MLKKTFAMIAIGGMIITACQKKQEAKVENTETVATDTTTDTTTQNEEIVTSTITNANGDKLDLSFNNTDNTATLVFNGETIKLVSERPASGIWYKNDRYELRGKGEDVELEKDGKVVFSHKGEKTITTTYKGKDGKELTVNAYNDTNTATLVFENETIDMKSEKPASGVWYKNDHYELRGKGSELKLTKDGKVVFESE